MTVIRLIKWIEQTNEVLKKIRREAEKVENFAIQFAIGAQLSGAFAKTFGTANGKLTALGSHVFFRRETPT